MIDFRPGTDLPAYFTYWRYPNADSYTVSPPEKPNSLRLRPSTLNLTALNGNYAGPSGQTFVGRRQQDTLFTFSVDLDYKPSTLYEEAGVSVFLTQNHHFDMGLVLLPANETTSPGLLGAASGAAGLDMMPQIRFRGMSYIPVPDPLVAPLPLAWINTTLRLEIKAANMSHYSFSVGPARSRSESVTVMSVSNQAVSWGFTGEEQACTPCGPFVALLTSLLQALF
jgi:hypothetical protein